MNQISHPQFAAEMFWRQGYLHLPGFFDVQLMDRLDALIIEHFGATPDFYHNEEFLEKAATEVVPWFPQQEGVAAFDEIDTDARLKALTSSLIGEDWNNLYSMVMFSKKGTAGQAWHQDCPPDNPAHHNLNRLIYTSDIVSEIGGEVVVMPGSHKKGMLPAGPPHQAMDGELVLRPKKGDLLFLHGHTWHRVLPVKKKYRSSVNYRAAPASAPIDMTDVCVYRNMRYRFSTNSVLEEVARLSPCC